MYISQLDIDSLGGLANKSLRDLTPGLNAIIANNGSGKSTSRAALRFGLFGIPPAKDNVAFENPAYYSKNRPLRRVQVHLSEDGRSLKITRESHDNKASGEPVFQPSDSAALFDAYLNGTSEGDFRAIWSASELDINAIDPQKTTTIKSIFASSFGVKSNPIGVLDNLESLHKSLLRSTETSTGFGKAYKTLMNDSLSERAIEQLSIEAFRRREKLDQLAIEQDEQETRYKELDDEFKAVNARSESFKQLAQQRAEAMRELKQASDAFAVLDAHRIEDGRLEVLKEEKNITRGEHTVEEYAKIKEELIELHQKKATLDEQLSHYLAPAFPLPPNDVERIVSDAFELGDYVKKAQAEVEKHELVVQTLNPEGGSASTVDASSVRSPLRKLALSQLGAFAAVGVSFLYFKIVPSTTTLIGLVVLALGSIGMLISGIVSLIKSKITLSSSNDAKVNELNLATKELREAQATYDAAQKRWEEFIALNFPAASDLEVDVALQRIRTLPTRLALQQERAQVVGELSERSTRLTSLQTTIYALYKRCFPHDEPAPESDIRDLLNQCLAALSAEQAAHKAFLEHERKLALASEKREKYAQSQHNTEAELAALAQEAGCSIEKLESYLADTIVQNETARRALNKTRLETSALQGNLLAELEGGITLEQVDELRAKLQVAQEDAWQKAREVCVNYVAQLMLKHAIAKFKTNNADAIISEANVIFARMTHNEYRRVQYTESGNGTFIVFDKEDNELTPEMLSLGTMRQLYLAIRFAVIKNQSKKGSQVPVVLDEVMASFDEERSVAVAHEINELAKDHQVFYFSARDDFRGDPIARDWNYVEILNA